MHKSLLLFLGFLLPTLSFGQTQRISFSVTAEEPCPDIKRQVSIFRVTNQADSLIYISDTLSSCEMKVEIPRAPGEYHLVIRTAFYDPIDVYFKLDETSAEAIILEPQVLKKRADQLEEVTITGIKKKFIQVDADKTTITVKDNDILTVSSIYDAIVKIPGIVPIPGGGGFVVSGRPASIYFEGIPSTLSGDDLMNLLKSLPASTVEKIEIISNPGASYDANVAGAIIDIISLSNVTKWLSGSLTMNYGVNANNKILPSLMLSGRNKKITWQVQTGYSHYERTTRTKADRVYTSFSSPVGLHSDRTDQSTNGTLYLRPNVTFKLNKKSSLTLFANGSLSDNLTDGNGSSLSEGITPIIDLKNSYKAESGSKYLGVSAKYKTKLDTLGRTLEITTFNNWYVSDRFNQSTQEISDTSVYSILNYHLATNTNYIKADLDLPFDSMGFVVRAGLKYSATYVSSEGKYNLNSFSDSVFQTRDYLSQTPFDYEESNMAAYVELKKRYKKLGFGGGLRVENFKLKRAASTTPEFTSDYLNFFPSLNAIYRFTPDILLIGTYSRKISIPSYNQFDPNNSGYYDSFTSNGGNINLKPNFFHNSQLKMSIFEYCQLAVDYSLSETLNLYEQSVEPSSLQTISTYRTYNDISTLSYSFSLPVPFAIFKEGFAFFSRPIDVDKLNFMYLYTERIYTHIPGMVYLEPNKACWHSGLYSQFILPASIRMNIDYYFSTNGTYQIYQFTQPRTGLEVVFTKEWFNKKLRTTLTVEDIFNTSQTNLRSAYTNLNLDYYTKEDTRIIWMKAVWSFGRYEKPDTDEGGINKSGPGSAEPIR